MKESRRIVAVFAAFCFVISNVTAACAAGFPDRAVTIILGQAAGGSTDILARLIGHGLGDKWGQPVIVENRPGANAAIAAGVVARAPADGYTVLFIGNPHTIVLPGSALGYDPVKSFAPITQLATSPDIFMVASSVPLTSLKDLIAHAKASPHQLNFGTPGNGTLQSLAMRHFMKQVGIDMVEVPFNGGAPELIALQGGEIQVALGSFSGGLPLVQSGKLKALAVSSTQRSAKLPEVPTMAEVANLSDFHADEWFGAVAPAGTPGDVIQKLHDAIVGVLHEPEVQQRLNGMGFTVVGNSPQDFGTIIARDTATWSDVMKSIASK